ncbi:calcium-binding tyrosine phosphorylation-regulated protein isoform X1 [Echinops telfairi]|uniref:Calcium-binding tyrosine phosphorylation-regulated protein isoform X1 n=2 Tax=Echinops telfairi TaxID=9371 RepID=A0AC55DKA4_ECHTE|nr:calcium-binding tyrosine phosphorylation-regulated protein isoform X1 [Echinops telfairi]XP_045152178.1 calcium-binding tyrosine phosphorylation-regulated protein isoform X1 [Echinops telfairi]
MISSKPRLVVPYGLKTLLEGLSRAILKTNPSNITQFAAVYFKELILYREGNTPMDVKELVKQFHQIKVEKWSEGTVAEKKQEVVKEPERPASISPEPVITRMEKSTDTQEDNITGPLFSSKTTQFPSVHAELLKSVDVSEVCSDASTKPPTPKAATPPQSPASEAVPQEFAYVPADPAQFAAQMLGNIPSVHSEQSDVLMVDVATSIPVFSEEVLRVEASEDNVVPCPVAYSGEVAEIQAVSQTSVHVHTSPSPKDHQPKRPTKASSTPLQDEQEPPAYDQAPEVPFQADIEVTSTLHIASLYNDVPVTEGVAYVEQMPEQIVIPFTDQVAHLKEPEQSPPATPPVASKTASGMSAKAVEAEPPVEVEDKKRRSSVHVEAEGTILLSDSSLKELQEVAAHTRHREGSVQPQGSQKSLILEMKVNAVIPNSTGQDEIWENTASLEMEVQPLPSEGPAKDVPSGTSVRSSSGPPHPAPEGLTEPDTEAEGDAAPEQGLVEPAIAASEAGQPPPYSNMWTLYCLTDMNQQSRPSPPPAPGPFPKAALYLPNPKDPQFLQHPPKVTSPAYVMMDDSKKSSAPPFILVGSNVQEAQDWKPVPGHAVVSQADALKRFAAVQVPIAVPAEQKFQKHSPNPQNANLPTSGPDGPRPQSPVYLSVAFPVEDVAKKSSGSGDNRTPYGSYGIAGEITVTTAQVRRAET